MVRITLLAAGFVIGKYSCPFKLQILINSTIICRPDSSVGCTTCNDFIIAFSAAELHKILWPRSRSLLHVVQPACASLIASRVICPGIALQCLCVGTGPSGTSVREISRQTGADIKSWTEKPDNKSASSRPTRSFVLEVPPQKVLFPQYSSSSLSQISCSVQSPPPPPPPPSSTRAPPPPPSTPAPFHNPPPPLLHHHPPPSPPPPVPPSPPPWTLPSGCCP